MRSMTCIAHLCVLALVLDACADQHTYPELNTVEGKQCVAQCRSTQGFCEDFERVSTNQQQQCENAAANAFLLCDTAAESEYTRCQQQSQMDYVMCVNNPSNGGACIQAACFKKTCLREGCTRPALVSFCESDFQRCYQKCAGVVSSRNQ